jgi:hypothetical protein
VGWLCPPYLTKDQMSWAFVWTAAAGMVELPALEGGYSQARAINAAGQIVGIARVAPDSMCDHACLWQPVIVTPEEATVALVDEVEDLNLQEGIDSGLDAKLDAALNALDDVNEHNDRAAISSLEAFIHAVEAQRGKRISDADADALIAAAEEIILLLSEGT